MQRPFGIICAALTPFGDDAKPSEKKVGPLLEYILSGGVDGLFILGTTGLGLALSVEERMRVAEAMVTTANGRVLRIVHVGSLVLEETLKLAKHAEEIGADAVACLTPFYYTLDEDGIIAYYKRLAMETGLPILIYNIPQRTGYNISPRTVARVAEDVPSVIGIKDSSMSLPQLIEIRDRVGEGFSVLNGSDLLILPSLAAGLDGSITALANVAPAQTKEVQRAFEKGDLRRAQQMQRGIAALARELEGRLIPALYAILNHLGIDVGEPRLPLRRLSQRERQEVIEKAELTLRQSPS